VVVSAIDLLRTWFEPGAEPPAAELAELGAAFESRDVPAKVAIVRAGDSPADLGVIARGLVRLFYVDRDGREFNKAFLAAGDVVGAFDTLLLGTPTRIWAETLEDSAIWFAPYRALTTMYARGAAWERIGRRFAEALYVKKIAREASLLMDTAAQRYDAFLRQHAAIENRIPDYHIASFLGLSAETLSRLKKTRTRQRLRRS
jgi:CRP/FNR family transcriptional regulator, anaerobic regulatory protein